VSRFDKDLQQSLKRRPPPAGFAERVLAKARVAKEHRWTRFFPGRWLMAGAAAVLVLGFGSFEYRAHMRQIEGERTKQQVLYALRLTGSTLRNIQERVSLGQQRK